MFDTFIESANIVKSIYNFRYHTESPQFARTGPLEEIGQAYDKDELAASEIKDKTVYLARRYQELTQLFKYLQKNMPKMDAVGGKAARYANIPPIPNKLVTRVEGKGLVKSATHWPGSMSKSAEAHIGEENTKYQKLIVQQPTERDLKHWFVSLCQLKGAQDTEGFQHFLKDDDAREIEHLAGGTGGCCVIS